MKVMHLRSSEFFGGPERAILGQCRSLQKADLHCVSFSRDGQPNDFLKNCRSIGVETSVIEEGFPGDFRVIRKIRDLIQTHQTDLIVTHDYKSNFYGYFAARRAGIPQVAHFRGRTTEDTKVKLYNAIDNAMLKRIPHVFAVSENSGRLLADLGVPKERIHVVFNAFDRSKLGDEPPDRRPLEPPLKIVTAGRLSREKGVDVLLEALSRVPDSVPPCEVHIFGNGPERPMLESQIDRLSLSNRVKLEGFVPDLLPVFRDMDFMVLPSRSEGMPNVILEAWSQGLGVLSTAVGGVPEMIDDGLNGLLARSEDPEHLAEKITEALHDPERMNEYGRRGFARLVTEYTFEKQAELLYDLYQRMLTDDQ